MAKKSVWEQNFASNAKIRDRVDHQLFRVIQDRRDERVEMETEWLEFFHMWNVDRDAITGYKGRAKLFIPEVRKNVESQARQLVKAAFPNEDFLECIPESTGTNEGADLQKQVRIYQAKRAKLRLYFHMHCRQLTMLGTSPVLLAWRKQMRKIFMTKKVKKKLTPTSEDVEIFNGPEFLPRDLFKWYQLNPLKIDLQEDGCFEDSIVNKFNLEKESKEGDLWGLSDLLRSAGDALTKGELERYVEKVEASGLILQSGGSAGEAIRKKPLEDFKNGVLCTTVYTNMVMPEMVDPDFEDADEPIPVKIKVYDGKHIGLIQRQQEFFQAAPYVKGMYILPQIDEAYGQGLVKAIKYMQHEINSKAEQSMDSVTLALNPISFIDPAQAGNMGSFEVEPGATWWVNPQGVKFGSIPDVSPAGYAAMAQIRALMADYSDRSPALPGQLQGKSRTLGQSEIVNNAIAIDTESFAALNEELVLEPAMKMWDSLTDQNITDDQILLLTGQKFRKAKKVLVPKAKLIGQYAYMWRGASVGQSNLMLTRQLMDFMKIVGTLPPEDKARLNPRLDVIAKMIFERGMELPDADKVFGNPEMESTDPETELLLLKKGFEIHVQPGDDDQTHLKAHDAQLTAKGVDDDMKEELTLHMAAHARQIEAKKQAAIQQQMMMAQLQMMQQQSKGGNSVGSGNRTQLSPNANAGDMRSGVRP